MNEHQKPHETPYAQTGILEAAEPEAASPRSSSIERGLPTLPFDALSSQYKIGIVKTGISKKQLEAIKSETDLNYDTLSNLLSISRTTLINKKGDDRFDPSTSERIMHLAEILCYGREVFECREIFNIWIRIPNNGLGGKSPLELLDTLYGIEEVKKELGRIEYGVY
ncbi:MAG: antitoxin Xre/MbcA/ParS toxin-binding domain-containing protein [Niastella sp.]|jgi:putative toxin-antitoxin system antitoxin component (TIGR02293 family)|uniref:type II RES/Xre toxin-antitoxin system antitoxin n=1 Tax=Niastella sp. TaxID=1869183 RepID=UPI00389AD694